MKKILVYRNAIGLDQSFLDHQWTALKIYVWLNAHSFFRRPFARAYVLFSTLPSFAFLIASSEVNIRCRCYSSVCVCNVRQDSALTVIYCFVIMLSYRTYVFHVMWFCMLYTFLIVTCLRFYSLYSCRLDMTCSWIHLMSYTAD